MASSFHRTSSPILTMSSQSAHQIPLDKPLMMHPSSSFNYASSWEQSLENNIASISRGRKRSRDEAAVNLDAPEKAPPAIEPVQEDEDEWEYGPGMVLIKKTSGYVRDASSQSGTWLEEQAAAQEALRKEEALAEQRRHAQERPSLRSHKSSRLDLTANLASRDASTHSNRASPKRDLGDSTPRTLEAGSGGSGSQPVIDDFTLHLGIGWSRLGEDEHIQAAARGWARYIENHYPITEPKILLESRGLESYLVEAGEGYFLFAEDLRQGRLVSSDPQRALTNLKSSPPVFDGDHTMSASSSGTPRPTEAEPLPVVPAVATATTAVPSFLEADMEMN
ncbi:hypothetical protein SPI_00078 [Niveomyces insectorum RCEF 264]|uniref:Uncharacterized protein n=1 Tax=Niveomyces insectorum RCEF 264 TaxID=1081102 RepID=A0A167ZT88_9HYPO|nr:hypothetical protein SPI_00078 [Niveomyces insectorum RCEF 264]